MKKFLAIILCVVMTLSLVLTGCGQAAEKPAAEKPEEKKGCGSVMGFGAAALLTAMAAAVALKKKD